MNYYDTLMVAVGHSRVKTNAVVEYDLPTNEHTKTPRPPWPVALCQRRATLEQAPPRLSADPDGVEHTFERAEQTVQPRVPVIAGTKAKRRDKDPRIVRGPQCRHAVELDPDDRPVIGCQRAAQGRKVHVVGPPRSEVGQPQLAAYSFAAQTAVHRSIQLPVAPKIERLESRIRQFEFGQLYEFDCGSLRRRRAARTVPPTRATRLGFGTDVPARVDPPNSSYMFLRVRAAVELRPSRGRCRRDASSALWR
jgi:hypothetical protein